MSEIPCIDYGGKLTPAGYGRYRVGGKMQLAHRVAYCNSQGITLESILGKVLRHTCDRPSCINPEHLVLGTQTENIADMNARKRQRNVHGIASPNAVLDDDKVRAIRKVFVKGSRRWGYLALARLYGVSDVTISHVVHRRQWAHVE